MPIKSRYATDSASMMDKAIKMMEAAGNYEAQAIPRRFRNPFKKPWGLHTNMETYGNKHGSPSSNAVPATSR